MRKLENSQRQVYKFIMIPSLYNFLSQFSLVLVTEACFLFFSVRFFNFKFFFIVCLRIIWLYYLVYFFVFFPSYFCNTMSILSRVIQTICMFMFKLVRGIYCVNTEVYLDLLHFFSPFSIYRRNRFRIDVINSAFIEV